MKETIINHKTLIFEFDKNHIIFKKKKKINNDNNKKKHIKIGTTERQNLFSVFTYAKIQNRMY